MQVAEEETEAMKLLKMYFPLTEYVKVINVSFKCYIGKTISLLKKKLNQTEMDWFYKHT